MMILRRAYRTVGMGGQRSLGLLSGNGGSALSGARSVAGAALVCGLAAMPSAASAQYSAGGGTTQETNSISIGSNSGTAPRAFFNSVAIGMGAVADPITSTGTNANANVGAVAVGANAAATNDSTVAIGAGSAASGLRSIAVGIGSGATGGSSVAIGDGAQTGAFANALALGSLARTGSVNSVAVGANATTGATGQNVAIGSGSTATAGTATGGAVANRGAVSNYRAYGMRGLSNSVGEVSLGSNGAERQLTNLAPGIAGTDGVNVNQLNALANTTNQQYGRLQQNIRASTALALATSGIRYDERPGKLSMGLGSGLQQGEVALALGLGKTSLDGAWRYNAAASWSPTNTRVGAGINLGVAYTFN